MTTETPWILKRIGIAQLDTPELNLHFGRNTLGRFPSSDICVKSAVCSRQHCILVIDNNNNITLEVNQVTYIYCSSFRNGLYFFVFSF